MKKEDIAGIELRHVTYCTDKRKENDLLVLNEYIHTKDGRRVKNMRFLKNYKRKFWVTKEARRDYTDDKQWIEDDAVEEYSSTQCNLFREVNRVLRTNFYSNSDAFKSPYVFGCGTTLQSEIKHQYYTRWKDFVTPKSEVAVLDTETDVIEGHEEVILCTITYKDKVFCAIRESFLKGTDKQTAYENIRSTVKEQIGEVLNNRGIEMPDNIDSWLQGKFSGFEIAILKTSGELINACIQKAHLWQPDFLSFWNMKFDMDKMVAALQKDGYNLADVFSDPRVPQQFRWFNWKPGEEVKTIHTGKTMPISPAEQWHIANAPASFFMVCAMTTYYRLRIALGKMAGGYSLDATLARHGKQGKLKFDKVTSKKLRWHQEMQRKYPYVYIAYNIMDCIAVEQLDEDIQDLNLKFNTRCTVADYTEFKSGPKMASVKMNYLVQRYGKKWGVSGGSLKTPNDELTVEYKGWPLTLPAYLIEESKVNVMSDWGAPSCLVYYNVSDLDISSTYPAVQVMLNISKSTTTREVIAIQKLGKYDRNRVFMDTVSGISSSISIANIGFGLPSLEEISDEFDEFLARNEVA